MPGIKSVIASQLIVVMKENVQLSSKSADAPCQILLHNVIYYLLGPAWTVIGNEAASPERGGSNSDNGATIQILVSVCDPVSHLKRYLSVIEPKFTH